MNARFTTLDPPNPDGDNWVRFEKVTGFDGTNVTYGNPIQIDLIKGEGENSNTNDLDDDGDGLVDESSIRIWEDFPPTSNKPRKEDSEAIIMTKVAGSDGLAFIRQNAVLLIELTVQEVVERGEPPATFTIKSGVMMRNE